MGVRGGNLVRLNIYFLVAVVFEMLRNLGYAWAVYGVTISSYFIFATMGVLAASLYFCPESNTLREAISRLKSRASFDIYELIALAWIILYLLFPDVALPFTIVPLTAASIYPTTLFASIRRRAKPPHVRKAMTQLSVSWVLFILVGLFLVIARTQPPILPISIPYAWEIGYISGSGLIFLMSLTVVDPLGSVKFTAGRLVPETIVKPGHRYLILHDSGKRAVSFLSSTLKSMIDSGTRVIITASSSGWLVRSLSQDEPRFGEWKKNGRVVISEKTIGHALPREGLSERLSFGPTSVVYLDELGRENLDATLARFDRETTGKHQEPAELFVLESSKAPRPQLTEFLRRNVGVELLNLSESTEPFSSMVNLDHQKIRGSTILLEYETNSNYESLVDKFLTEGIGNAELAVLFTTKSSKLYRAIKGKRMTKIIAASSLISAPDDLPDGEMQIPDKELGLVASIVSDFIDNSKDSGASFVFDSITELIRGERWEQVYSGIKQLIELLSVPNATALFLANENTLEPRFLGALRGAFAMQMKLDDAGLKAIKVPAN
jgi:hypothetical protein